MYIPQPQEVGLPIVKDVVEISCLPGSKDVAHLREQIYDTAFSLTGNVIPIADIREEKPIIF